jgi:Zn-dependent protease
MFIIVRIGWAKPVPINPYNFRDPAKGSMVVAFAGPVSNFLLAWIVATAFRFVPAPYSMNGTIVAITSDFIFINIALAVFNLIPLPPLDGSHIIEPFISAETMSMLEQYGFIFLLLILIFPPTAQILMYIITFVFRLIT